MSANHNDVIKGYRIPAQIRLDAKSAVQNEAALKDLGPANNLAFTYHEGLEIYCKNEKTKYVWREVVGLEVGLMLTNFTYPIYSAVDGINYSSKVFNFFAAQAQTSVSSGSNITVTGTGSAINPYVISGPAATPIPNGSETKVNAGTNVTVTGLGTIASPYIVNSSFTDTNTTPPFILTTETGGAGNGIFLRDRVAANYGPIGESAFDISYSFNPSSTRGAIGGSSFAAGVDVSARNYASVVFGHLIDNNGIASFNAGINLKDSGYNNSLFGAGHDVTSISTTVIGQASNIIADQILDYNATADKKLFVIGNGNIANNNTNFTVLSRSDAFVVRKNGLAVLPSITNALIAAESTGKVLITREYLTSVLPSSPTAPDGSETKLTQGTNITITGTGTIASPYTINTPNAALPPLETLNEGLGNGIVLRGRNPLNYGIIGLNAVDLSVSENTSSQVGATGLRSYAQGLETTASGVDSHVEGIYSTAFGVGSHAEGVLCYAEGENSHAEGSWTYSKGFASHAEGGDTRALGDYSHAGGKRSQAHGDSAHATGSYSQAYSFCEFAGGTYTTPYTASSKILSVGTDRLINFGNGTFLVPSDAFTVLKNGLATLPSVTNALITAEATGKAIVTREYLTSVLPIAPNGSETKLNSGISTSVSGLGTIASPYVVETSNLQRILTMANFTSGNYTILNSDNNHVLIIQNGATPVTITIPAGLSNAHFVGYTQEGTAEVSFITSGTVLRNPIGFKIKGLDYQASTEQNATTNTFHIHGNTKL